MFRSPSFNAYPTRCRFPTCDGQAPRVPQSEVALCAQHEQLRFYAPEQFMREWTRLVFAD